MLKRNRSFLIPLTLAALAAFPMVAARADTGGPGKPYLTYSILSSSQAEGEFFQTIQFTLHNPVGSQYNFSDGFAVYETGFPGEITDFSNGPVNPPPGQDQSSAAFNAFTNLGDACSGAVIPRPGPRPGGDGEFTLSTVTAVDPPSITDYSFYLFDTPLKPDVYEPKTVAYSFSQPLADYGPISYALAAPNPVPEDSTLASFGMGLTALLLVTAARRRKARG